MSGMIRATVWERRVLRLRASPSGRYPSSATASSTRAEVPLATGRFRDSTCETVVLLTPARSATSAMVTLRDLWGRLIAAEGCPGRPPGVKRPAGLSGYAFI